MTTSDILSPTRTDLNAQGTERGLPNSLLLATVLSLGMVAIFAALSESVRHWFVIPVVLCGVLIGSDAIDWVLGRVDLFDPVGVVGLLGAHFFFVAPLLHVYRDYWMLEIADPPPDWRDWLGYMALLNLAGLLMYRIGRDKFAGSRQESWQMTIWQIDVRRFWISVTIALMLTASLQFWVYVEYGGLISYVTTLLGADRLAAAQGQGWLFTISETFPSFAILAWAVFAREKTVARSWLVIALVLVIFFLLKMLFGGLRASRSNTVWGMVSAVGVIHLWIRSIPRKLFLLGGFLLVIFMYGYGFVKAAGLDGLRALSDQEARDDLTAQSGRTLDYVILGDLGRSDVQAFLLYRLSLGDSDYEYAWGSTYLGGMLSLVPSALFQDRPPTKVKAGTEAQFGAGTFQADGFRSSRIYGLAGEAMLNFGVLAAPFGFLVLAFIVSRVRRTLLIVPPQDARLLMIPTLSIFCFVVLATDSDNLALFVLKEIVIPFGLLLFSIRVTAPGSAAPS